MHLAITKSSVLYLLLAISGLVGTAGCSASKAPMPKLASPAMTTIADSSHDPSWTPPGELDVSIAEASRSSSPTTVNAEAMPRPNRRAIPRGQLHAATY
jgi:hypothetical protein